MMYGGGGGQNSQERSSSDTAGLVGGVAVNELLQVATGTVKAALTPVRLLLRLGWARWRAAEGVRGRGVWGWGRAAPACPSRTGRPTQGGSECHL